MATVWNKEKKDRARQVGSALQKKNIVYQWYLRPTYSVEAEGLKTALQKRETLDHLTSDPNRRKVATTVVK